MHLIKWHAMRATAWAMIWIYMNPELRSIETWSSPDIIGWLIGMYFVTGFILETVYRVLAWGRLFPKVSGPAVIRPECPEHPWICLINEYPRDGMDFEVFCADGKARLGNCIRKDDGELGIVVRFTAADEKQLAKSTHSLRPTHWRALKQTAENEKENMECK